MGAALLQDWWTHVASKDHLGFAHDPEEGRSLLRLWVYGKPSSSTKITRLTAIRRLMEHNSKVIHGVPKHQLLVWDVHK